MVSLFGHYSVLCALVVALLGAVASFASVSLHRPALLVWGRRGSFLVCGIVTFACALMIEALVTHDFSVKYVADVGSRTTPLYYTVISLWAALEGSILFWALILSGYTVVFLISTRGRFGAVVPYANGVLLTISAFFLFVIAFPGNPFALVSPARPSAGCPADGCGPNPLLQNHPMMGLHPPLLYLGYVGLSVPYAIAVGSLLARSSGPDVLQLIRRWALISWVFLSLGITAGMWWSYAVLGWGGYWSWDPVENASVMPWLVTTAFLHSLQVQERRRMLKTWTMSLIVAAWLLSIFGTFLTRSGVLQSVHSFTETAIGPVFLTFFAVYLVASVVLIAVRSADLSVPGSLDAVVCRETAFMVNNLLLIAITFTVLLGTIFPLLAEAVQGSQLSVGAPYFDHIAVPIGLALLFLLGVGPALPWGAARLDDLQYRLVVPVAIGVAVVIGCLAIGVRGIGPLVTFGLSGFALAVTVGRTVADIHSRRRNTGDAWFRSGARVIRANPRRYGGYVAHVGVLLVVVGIAASQSYALQTTKSLRPGESVHIAGYTLRYLGFTARPQPNRMVLQANFHASRGGENLGTLSPSLNFYATEQQPVVTPSVAEQPWNILSGTVEGRSPLPALGALFHGENPFEDVYVVLQGIDAQHAGQHNADRTVLVQVLVNPLVGLIWLGGMLLGLGGMAALVPARKRRRVTETAPERLRGVQREEVPV
jgi:cytochrome c-type biogenesis protein CcmF